MNLNALLSTLVMLLKVLAVACVDVVVAGVLACLIYAVAQIVASWRE
ncbi:MAG: hypothetical protein LIO95_10015 [Clostridiales bacterium]|nr:hypothetical protein [Clostridiales bacterium]